jgi:putative hemolysin
MILLIFYFFSSHLVSFLCSILEAVLLSCTNGYVSLLKRKNPKVGHILADLKARIDRPLAAILTLNTSAHTFGAAGIGAKTVELYGDQWLGLVSVIITLTMLFVTEMIPKTIGALYWKKMTPFAAYCIKGLIFVMYPFVVSFEYIARYLSRGKKGEKITNEEIKHILEEGMQAGVIKPVEQDMMESIFRLGNRRVGALMIPRVDIEWLNLKNDFEKIREQIQTSSHSRFPVCNGELDKAIGILTTKDFFSELSKKGFFDLKKIVRTPLFVPENMRVLQLLDVFKKSPEHLAIVADEYGGVQGMITLHDVLESIVGDVPSNSLLPEMPIIQRKDGSWLVEGMLPIDELKEQFDIDAFPHEEHYRTLGGFCMFKIGGIPKVGDSFIWKEFKFKIVKMDDRRVEKVLINYLPE